MIWFSKRSFLFFLAVSFLTGYLLSQFFSNSNGLFNFPFRSGGDAIVTEDSFDIRRIEGYELIKPIVSAGSTRESASFAPLKKQLETWIDSLKTSGTVTAVSVYLESLERETWTHVNRNETFHPASFLKVPLMIGFLRMAQANPALLEEEVVFQRIGNDVPNTLYFTPPKELVPGEKYTLHEILEYMIVYSDNYASRYLAQYVDFTQIQKLFADLSMKAADPERIQMKMDAYEFSTIMKSIFNSSLLSPDYSEYAAKILSKCTFKEGFSKGFPEDTKMWHKFGEWSYPGTDFELNESGVIFLNNKPYLLTVLTKGKDMEKLPGIIASASKKVSDHLLRKP